ISWGGEQIKLIAACSVRGSRKFSGEVPSRRATPGGSAEVRGYLAKHGGEAQTAPNISKLTVYFTVAVGSDPPFAGGQGRNRTTDTRIFNPITAILGAYESTTCSACQPRPHPHSGTIPPHPSCARQASGTGRSVGT